MHTNTTVRPTAKHAALAAILFAAAMFGAVAIDPAVALAVPSDTKTAPELGTVTPGTTNFDGIDGEFQDKDHKGWARR